jgi:hypothetical protein
MQNVLHEGVSLFVMRTLPVLLVAYYSQLIRFINTLAELITIPRRRLWCVGIVLGLGGGEVSSHPNAPSDLFPY